MLGWITVTWKDTLAVCWIGFGIGLILLIDRILELRVKGTVRVTKVKEHVDEETVRVGQVRELDKLGNSAADEAADFRRRRGTRWYPVILEFSSYFIAISRVVVIHDCDGGTVPDSLV